MAGDDAPATRKDIDFSRVTPRRLLEYVNQQQFAGLMDPKDAGALLDQVPVSAWTDAPDAPINIRAGLKGTMEFHMDRGSPLAAWYAGLINRLDAMEAQSLGVDVFA